MKTGNSAIGNGIAANKAYVGAEDGVVKYVFVVDAYEDAASETSAVAYVDVSTGKKSTTKEDGKTTTIWTYDAYSVDGKISVTQKATAQLSDDALYKLNDDNTIGAVVTTTTGVITKIEGSVVMIGSTALNVVDETKEIYVGDDAALAVGQTVAYKCSTATGKTKNIETIVVTADQVTKALTLAGTVTGYSFTTDSYEVITGTGVVNTVKVTVKKDSGNFAANKAVTLAINSVAGQAVVGTVTPTSDTTEVTFEVTVTAPTADTTITVSNVTVA